MINKIKDFFIKNGIETDEAKAEANFLVCEVSGLPIEKIIHCPSSWMICISS